MDCGRAKRTETGFLPSGVIAETKEKPSNNCNLKQNEVSVWMEVEAARRGDAEGRDRDAGRDAGKGLPAQEVVLRLAVLQP